MDVEIVNASNGHDSVREDNQSFENGSNASDGSDSEVEIVNELKVTLEEHSCDVCSEGNFLLNRLLRFGGVLNDEKKFVCEICDKGFKLKSNLKRHMKKHADSDSNSKSKAASVDISALQNSSNKNVRKSLPNAKKANSLESVTSSLSMSRNSLPAPVMSNIFESTTSLSEIQNQSFTAETTHCVENINNQIGKSKIKHACNFCRKSYSRKSNLDRHLTAKHALLLLNCNM